MYSACGLVLATPKTYSALSLTFLEARLAKVLSMLSDPGPSIP